MITSKSFLKDWNTIAAMANTIGGIILVGIDEDLETRPKLPLNGVPFKKGLQEQVISIILSNITPPVFPEIGIALSEDKTKAIVIVRIYQSHETPHAIAQNTRVYLRTGNRNDPEERASVDKIEWLLNGRRKSETLRESLYDRAEKRFFAQASTFLFRSSSKASDASQVLSKMQKLMCEHFVYSHGLPEYQVLMSPVEIIGLSVSKTGTSNSVFSGMMLSHICWTILLKLSVTTRRCLTSS